MFALDALIAYGLALRESVASCCEGTCPFRVGRACPGCSQAHPMRMPRITSAAPGTLRYSTAQWRSIKLKSKTCLGGLARCVRSASTADKSEPQSASIAADYLPRWVSGGRKIQTETFDALAA